MKNSINQKGFTLIEILIGILIFSIVIIGGFKALSSITVGKIRLIQKTNIEKQSIYFTEKLFETIKMGGTLDYEEYFNRKVVGTSYLSGHYQKETGFGNFGSGGVVGQANNFGDNFYYCRSGNGVRMGTGGCFNNTYNNYGSSPTSKPQRYGEYSFQFIDYNSNYNSDLGDEDGNGSIIGDDDDEYLGVGPSAFTPLNTKEIYLISGDKKTRTLLRWNVIKDPDTPAGITCTFGNGNTPTGSGCLGNIQFLKLEGKDWGFNHNKSGTGAYDGVVDTWLIHNDFTGGGNIIAGSGSSYEKYWQDLFPKNMNITNFIVKAYPNKDIKLSWKESVNISPYLRISFSIAPAWKERIKMKGHFPELKFATTINLTKIFGNKFN